MSDNHIRASPMTLDDMLRALPRVRHVIEALQHDGEGEQARTIHGITDDSRQVEPGFIFVAVQGATVDGHRFIPTACDAGAAAIVGELPAAEAALAPGCAYVQVPDSREALGWLHAAWYGFPSDDLTLVGVTGTDGKTTTTNLAHAILTAAGVSAGMVSTVNARIGGESVDTGLHTTTPYAAENQRYLAQMVAQGATHAVLEATSHGLVQHRLAGCEFDVAVFTNVTHEHLDYHGSWEAYLDAKARLLRGLTDQRRKTNADDKAAVLNMDDASYRYLRKIDAPRRITYSVETSDADVWARDIACRPEGLSFTLESAWGSVPMASPLVGLFNVSNILAAASAALALKVPLSAIATGVATMAGVPGRMESIDEGQSFLAIVDFAHTPNALRRAIEAAHGMASDEGRVIVVFGSAGLRDREKRRLMGEVAGEAADLVVVTAEDPRTESLVEIMNETAQGLQSQGREAGIDYWLVPDRGQALLRAVEMARAGDVVMACGKGHEQSMCFGTHEYPWDDREAMRLALQGATLKTLPTDSA